MLKQFENYKRNHQGGIDGGVGEFTDERLIISLNKKLNVIWSGNLKIKSKFDKDGVKETNISTLRPRGKKLLEFENKYFEISEDISNKLINFLNYQSGQFDIDFTSRKEISFTSRHTTIYSNIDIHFDLSNIILKK